MTASGSLDRTHDPSRKSWLASANRGETDFPLQNLPFAVFRRARSNEAFRSGVAIGDQIVDLAALHALRIVEGEAATALAACTDSTLNRFMKMGAEAWSALRFALSDLLYSSSPHAQRMQATLVPQAEAEYGLPAKIGGYTDFYTSIHHAVAVGSLFRPDNPLLPNYKWVPIGYHGRTSSIGVSEQTFRRPQGQLLPPGANAPVFGPSKRLDYELELGVFIGVGNALGERIPIEAADEHVFGLCLLNDWSARDLQAWEYQPLGPFLGKNFATTISPWIVTLSALAPFRTQWSRVEGDPQPLSYLDSRVTREQGAFDIELEAYLETEQMRRANIAPQRLSRSNYRHAFWTVAQMVTHHTVNGCNLEPGDLLGTGTLSGPRPEEAGSLLELSRGGKQPLSLADGETRTFLADEDRVIFRAHCEKAGYARIGFGAVSGRVLPAAP